MIKQYLKIYFLALAIIFSVGIVSATISVQTCMKMSDGRSCVPFTASECAANCQESCIPTAPSLISDCKAGTCYDEVEGTCSINVLKKTCEADGGKWFDDKNGNVAVCKKGCCSIGQNSIFSTERECARTAESLGIEKIFKPEINSEWNCLGEGELQREGACVLGKDVVSEKNLCKFTTREACIQLKGDFREGILCSHPELNTVCEKQEETGCVEGKDEVYWLDSCDNRENIYDENKVRSWNDGKVLSKADSCSLASGNNPFTYQGTCGNCDYRNIIAGSKCGDKTSAERLNDNTQDFVCRDLSCTDESGNKRVHGESWCVYQSGIGLDENRARAIDTPGSRHFRHACFEGQIVKETCTDYRNDLCIETKTLSNGNSYSNALCKTNRYNECIQLNAEDDKTKAMEDCREISDCFVKKVAIDSFAFDMCAPKYPPGFNWRTSEERAEQICSVATQQCSVGFVKTTHGWKCRQNCNCLGEVFTQQMNDLCMSLGDCGASVNYIGKMSENYITSRAPRLGSSYLSGISDFYKPIPGKIAEPGNDSGFEDMVLQNVEVESEWEKYGLEGNFFNYLRDISGVSGIMTLYIGLPLPQEMIKGIDFVDKTGGGSRLVGALQVMRYGPAGIFVSAINARIMYEAWKKAGFTQVLEGLSPGEFYALSSLATNPTTALYGVMWGFVLQKMGIGKSKVRVVEFKCEPWLPPRGGDDCAKCGKDGFPCSTYSCQSLGTRCEFVNEGTSQERCVKNDQEDATAPIISPLSNFISTGFRYGASTELGVQIESTAGDGCIPLYTPVEFGISLDDVGKCRFDVLPGIEYGDMEFNFGHAVFNENQSIRLVIPSVEGEELPSYDPNARAEYNLYVKCENVNGYSSSRDYIVKFCVKPGVDLTAPLITIAEPANGYVKYGASSQNITIFTNEPADCRGDLSDKNYSIMASDMDCLTELTDQKTQGWQCTFNVPVTKDKTSVFMRCSDKPFEADDSKRNANRESVKLDLVKTAKLEIKSATPDGETITSGVEPASVSVKVTTSGGVDGSAGCLFSFDGKIYIDFADTFSSTHEQVFESFEAGNKRVMIKCADDAGNIAEKTINFKVEIDSTAPKVTRAYYQAGALVVKTNEPASCYLSKTKCNFEFENATLMSGAGFEHTSSVDASALYYVRCKDEFDNAAGSCNMELRVSPTQI